MASKELEKSRFTGTRPMIAGIESEKTSRRHVLLPHTTSQLSMRLARAQSIREAPPHPHLAEPIREHYLVRTASARDPSPGIIHKDATTSRVPSTGTREAPSTATSRDDTLKPRAANNVAKSACTHLHSDPPSRPGSTTPAGPPLGHRTRRDRCPSAAEAACPPPPDAPGGRRRVLRLPAWLSGPSKHLSGAHDDPRGDVSWSVMVARHHREAARIPNDLPSTASVPAGLVRAALRAVDAICSPSLGVRVQVPAVVSLTQAFLWCRTPLQCQVLCAEVSSKRLAKSLRALLSSGEVYSTCVADVLVFLSISSVGQRDMLDAGILPTVTGVLRARSGLPPLAHRTLLSLLLAFASSDPGCNALSACSGLRSALYPFIKGQGNRAGDSAEEDPFQLALLACEIAVRVMGSEKGRRVLLDEQMMDALRRAIEARRQGTPESERRARRIRGMFKYVTELIRARRGSPQRSPRRKQQNYQASPHEASPTVQRGG